ncbi:hypothetical protein [Holophaga foetida]|uniref:hypothetical protein n=1 Tax=Holophaga foetida TaxID=35839 RepID=UPI0011DD4597|nr:hypothetical protein [Holophaga foetida]
MAITHTRCFEADLAPSPLGCRLRLEQEIRGPLGWLFGLFCARRWKREMVLTARRVAGGTGRC